jgi:hypothetical protein
MLLVQQRFAKRGRLLQTGRTRISLRWLSCFDFHHGLFESIELLFALLSFFFKLLLFLFFYSLLVFLFGFFPFGPSLGHPCTPIDGCGLCC